MVGCKNISSRGWGNKIFFAKAFSSCISGEGEGTLTRG